MPIDPRISLGVQPLQVADPLAQYGQVQNILAAQSQMRGAETQQQMSQMQLEQMRRDEATLKQIQDKAVQGGGPSDINKIAEAYLQSGNRKFVEFGIELRQKLDERAQIAKIMGLGSTSAPAMPSAAPAFGALGSGTYGAFPEPANQLAPAPAPVNKLAPGPTPAAAPDAAPSGLNLNTLLNQQAAFMAMGKPEMARALDAKITLASRQQPETIREMQALNIPITPEGLKQYATLKQAPPQPIELTKALADRDKLIALGRPVNDPDVVAYTKLINKLTTHTPPISVSYGPQEKAEKIEYGKLLIDDFKNIKAQATVATKSLPAIESNLAILDKGFDTGFGTETIAAGASVLAALGVQNAKEFATNAQTFLASANAAVLQRQLEQKGPQTESDAQRITATGAQLGNTKDANKFVLNVAKAQLQRDLKQREFYAAWRDKNKTFEGAEDAWYAGEGGKSLFDSPALKKYGTNVVDQIPGQSRAAPAATTIPQAAIDALKSGKGTDAQFDAIFGAGAAKRARGGK
jgi:hypothetical protein